MIQPDYCQTREWKPVLGYEKIYSVSNDGLVRRETRNGWKLLHPFMGGRRGDKRPKVTLSRVGTKKKHVYVHIIVLEAFVGARPKWHIACHMDNNPLNNKISNLRWDTEENNMLDRKLPITYNGKLTDDDVMRIHSMLDDSISCEEVACEFWVPRRIIYEIKGMLEPWKTMIEKQNECIPF
jgi:hypothetical protein